MTLTLDAVVEDQKAKVNQDAAASFAGVIISPIFFAFLSGNTAVSAEVARVKGEYEAVNRALVAKHCPAS